MLFLPENADDFRLANMIILWMRWIPLLQNRACHESEGKDIPIISSMGAGNKLDGSQFKVADIYKTKSARLQSNAP